AGLRGRRAADRAGGGSDRCHGHADRDHCRDGHAMTRFAVVICLWAFLSADGPVYVNPTVAEAAELPEGVQGYTLSGQPLVSARPDPNTVEQLESARADYEEDPQDADNIIW